jgi:AMMECR1 domain-containing protein
MTPFSCEPLPPNDCKTTKPKSGEQGEGWGFCKSGSDPVPIRFAHFLPTHFLPLILRNVSGTPPVENTKDLERTVRHLGVFVWLAIALTPSLALAQDAARLIPLARQAVEAEVKGQQPPQPSTNTPSRGVFVTIEKDGKILGCRGSLTPLENSLEAEIIRAARGAAKHDPRYRPVGPKDLSGYLVTVTVVQDSRPIDNVDGLQPSEGLVLKCGDKTGVVLPWEGKDPNTRLEWAYKKAGVPRGSPVSLFKLIAERERG